MPASSKRPASSSHLEDEESTTKRHRTFKETHTIDSDDEEAVEEIVKPKYSVLDDEDIEGQEEGLANVQEGVRITPFNIQEELEEGHFDTEGNYHLDKEKEVRDAWLENLDEYTDEVYEKLRKKKSDENAALEAAAPPVKLDTELYRTILSILNPGESVAKAIRRLGSGIKPVLRLKKKEKDESVKDGKLAAADPVKEQFDKLTSAADTLLGKGNLEIYQDTYEKIAFNLTKIEASSINFNVVEEEDIFGEAFVSRPTHAKAPDEQNVSVETSGESDQTLWEYKWENSEKSETHGPYSSEQMNEWVKQDFFKDGVFVRKAGVIDGPFYSSRRVDFELYL